MAHVIFTHSIQLWVFTMRPLPILLICFWKTATIITHSIEYFFLYFSLFWQKFQMTTIDLMLRKWFVTIFSFLFGCGSSWFDIESVFISIDNQTVQYVKFDWKTYYIHSYGSVPSVIQTHVAVSLPQTVKKKI